LVPVPPVLVPLPPVLPVLVLPVLPVLLSPPDPTTILLGRVEHAPATKIASSSAPLADER
jgi:hypothetical protein